MLTDGICKMCGLYQYSDNPKIKGRGSDIPRLILIGEAPGPDEAKAGQVFIGKAGRKLNQMLMPYQNLDIHITNAVKCFPPLSTTTPTKGFRVPKLTEIEFCRNFLTSELAELSEKSILARCSGTFTISELPDTSKYLPILMPLGNTALYAVTGIQGGITSQVGQIQRYAVGIYTYEVIPNYHPSYICRNPKMESEFIRVMNICKEYMENKYSCSRLNSKQ